MQLQNTLITKLHFNRVSGSEMFVRACSWEYCQLFNVMSLF